MAQSEWLVRCVALPPAGVLKWPAGTASEELEPRGQKTAALPHSNCCSDVAPEPEPTEHLCILRLKDESLPHQKPASHAVQFAAPVSGVAVSHGPRVQETNQREVRLCQAGTNRMTAL